MAGLIEDITRTLRTGVGAWSSLIFIVVLVVAFLMAYVFWKRGNQNYQKRTMQVQPFLSGNALPDPEEAHLGADNLLWGFTHALRNYYDVMEKGHTGSLNDYAAWFVLVFAFLLIVVTVGGA